MKLVLIIPNFDTYTITPQLGVLYISSFLKKHGHNVVIIDALKDNLTPNQILKITKKENPDAIGVHCLSSFYKEASQIIKLLKIDNYIVFVGGVHPTFAPYTTLKETGADFVVIGEGELPILELANNNFKNNNIQGIYSINDLLNDELTKDNKPIEHAQIIENLDEIPFPDWEQVRLDTYPQAPHAVLAKGYPIGIITTSRGCPYRCTFCSSHNFYKGKVRFRSIDNVIEEIKYLIKEFSIKELQFIDDNLTLKKDYAMKLCQRMIDEGIKIDWTPINGIRADSLTQEVADKMKEAGCYLIDFGIESVNPEILKNIKKGETIERITEAINCAHNAGIMTLGNFIFGLPGDTKETIDEAINYAINSKLDRAGFFAFNVLPGSDIAKQLKIEKGIEITNSNLFSTPSESVCSLTPKQIEKYIQKAYWKFYFRPKILFNALKSIPIKQYKYFIKCLCKYNIFKFW